MTSSVSVLKLSFKEASKGKWYRLDHCHVLSDATHQKTAVESEFTCNVDAGI